MPEEVCFSWKPSQSMSLKPELFQVRGHEVAAVPSNVYRGDLQKRAKHWQLSDCAAYSQKRRKIMTNPTLRELSEMNPDPSSISESALVLVDCQQTFREGVMQLVDYERALEEAAELLRRFRAAGRPVIHIMHDAGPGTPFDVSTPAGQIVESVAPIKGETVIVKNYPSAFDKTPLDAELKKLGITKLIYAGFMTHMCLNSTVRASFTHGYANTLVAGATATRSIPNPANGKVISAAQLQDASLSALGDLFAVVVPHAADVPS
jgi:nicotinamidase-related amidase